MNDQEGLQLLSQIKQDYKLMLAALREIATTRIDTEEEKELHREIAKRCLKEIGEEV